MALQHDSDVVYDTSLWTYDGESLVVVSSVEPWLIFERNKPHQLGKD
jgi:hypothetical protein